jgi:hypothetical protein
MNQTKKHKVKQHHPKPKKKQMTEIEPGKVETRPEDAPEPPGDYPQEPYRDEEAGLDEDEGAGQHPGHA